MTAGTMILETFYRSSGQFVSAAQLAKLMLASTGKVAAEVAELEKLGYVIELHPHHGYRLLESPNRLMADDLEARLESFEAVGRTRVIGSEILVFKETASTNDVCEQLGRSGGRDGLVVFAESQTKGRGRYGRAWVSPRGKGLWFSVLLRPNLPVSAVPRITVAASVAVARAIRKTSGLDARIKWPNDVTVNGKKLAGILVETSARFNESSKKIGGTVPPGQCVILGIGIDVNCAATDFPSEVAAVGTSLQLETGLAQNRPALATAVLQAVDECYVAAQNGFDALVAEWAQLCTTLGKQIVVTTSNRRIEGHAQALDSDGALLLRKDNGQIERILGGDVTVERA